MTSIKYIGLDLHNRKHLDRRREQFWKDSDGIGHPEESNNDSRAHGRAAWDLFVAFAQL